MCYNDCNSFRFNPFTGEGTCGMKKGQRCPEDIPLSDCCGTEMHEWPDSDICPGCKEHCGIEDGEGEEEE